MDKFQTTFSINNQMSGELSKIISSLEKLDKLTDTLNDSLSSLDDENFNSLHSSLNEVSNGLSNISKSTSVVQKSLDTLGSKAKGTVSDMKKLDSVSFSGVKSGAKKAATSVETIGKEANSAKSDLKEISSINLDNGSADSLSDSLASLNDAVDLSNFMNITEFVGKAVDKVGELTEAAMGASDELQGMTANLKMSLGDIDTSGLENIVLDVKADNYGESIDDVTEKLAYLKQMFGDTVSDSDLKPLLEQFISLDAAGMDFTETVRGVRNLVATFGVDAQTATDFMAEGMQRGLNFSDELGDNIAEYAGRWGDAGVSLGNYFSLLEAGTKSGAYNLDKVGDFLNEFMTSLTDGRMDEAMTSMSSQTQAVFESYKQGGANAQDVLNAVLGELQGMESATDRAAVSSTLWSSLGEDNAMSMIMALNGVTDSYGNVSGAAQQVADANYSSVGELQARWEIFKTRTLGGIGTAFADLAVGALHSIDSITSTMSNLWNGTITFEQLGEQGTQAMLDFSNGFAAGLPDLVTQGANAITSFLTGVYQKMSDLTLGAWDMIINYVQALGENMPSIMQKGGETILALAQGISNNLPTIIGAAITSIGSYISGLLQRLPDIIAAAGSLIRGLVTGLISALPDILATGMELIKGLALSIWNNLPTIVNAGLQIIQSLITGVLKGAGQLIFEIFQLMLQFGAAVVQAIPKIFESASQIGQSLADGIRNGISGAWNALWSFISEKINGFVQFIKDLLGIASPSKIFIDIGDNLIQGFLGGLKGAWDTVTSWAESAWNGLKGIFSGLFGGGEEQSTDTGLDYTETINRVSAQLDQLNAIVAQKLATVTATGVQQSLAMTLAINESLLLIDFSPLSQKLLVEMATIFTAIQQQTISAVTAMAAAVLSAYEAMVQAVIRELSAFAGLAVQAVASMETAIMATTTSFSTAYLSLWGATLTALANSISRNSQTVIATIKTLCEALKTEIAKLQPAFSMAGRRMMASLENGILSKKSDVVSTVSSLVTTLKETFEKGLGIHSPSVYMTWVGEMLMAGLMNGMSGAQIQSFIESIIGDMQNSFKNGKFNANELVNFLSDEGTLNLIGRVSGLDMSNIAAQQIAYPLIGTMGTQTSWFGYRPPEDTGGIGTTNHGGVDLAAPEGTPIAAALDGTVNFAGYSDGYGNLVTIAHGNGIETYYGHMSQILTQTLAPVKKGQQIGLVGSTGNSTGPHLHFEVRQNDNKIDPQPYLEGAGLVAGGNSLSTAIQNAYNAKHGLASTSGATMSGVNVSYNPSAGVSQWSDVVLQALAMLGQPASLLSGVLYAIENESGGNPNAINDWDSNAAMGDPSRGLLQTIGSTFMAYRNPSLSDNIYDPLANIYAALNYMIQRYGSVDAVVSPRLGGWYGYAVGTRYVPQDMLAMIHKGEAILPAGQNPYTNSGGDYLGDLASQIVSYPTNNAADYIGMDTPSETVISVGNVSTTVQLQNPTNASATEIARAAKDMVIQGLKTELTRKAGVAVAY